MGLLPLSSRWRCQHEPLPPIVDGLMARKHRCFPVLSKNAAINYISKYASKTETMSTELDKTISDLMNGMPDTDGIKQVITKTLNKFCIERDFSAQEACHQILGSPMVECCRTFDSISLPVDLTVTRVLRGGRRQRDNPDAIGLQAAQ